MKTLTRKLLREVVHFRGQLITIVIVIACGVANFIAFRGVHASLQLTMQSYYESSHFADLFVTATRAPDAVRDRIEAIDGVEIVETSVAANVLLDLPNVPQPASGTIYSVPDAGQPEVNRLFLRSGRWIQRDSDHEVIVSRAFAEANGYQEGDTFSAVINGKKRALVIVGTAISPEHVIEVAPGTINIDNKHYGIMWMSRHALSAAYDMVGAFNSASMTIDRHAEVADIKREVDALLKPYGSVGCIERSDQLSHRFLESEIRQVRATAILVPTIFFGVAIFLLNVSLLRLVSTQ